MPRALIQEGKIYHIYNRAISPLDLFNNAADFCRFLGRQYEYEAKFGVELHAFCLMKNHFHFLVAEPIRDHIADSDIVEKTAVSRFMHSLQMSYAKYFSQKYQHMGHLFQSKYNAKIIKDEVQYLETVLYILNNPAKKGLVKDYREWPYLGINYDLTSTVGVTLDVVVQKGVG